MEMLEHVLGAFVIGYSPRPYCRLPLGRRELLYNLAVFVQKKLQYHVRQCLGCVIDWLAVWFHARSPTGDRSKATIQSC